MSLDGQNLLDEYKSLIRERAVAWDAYIRYNLLTEADVRAIKAVDKVPASRRREIVEGSGADYAQLVLGDDGVLRKSANSNRVDLVQYILMWTGDLLEDVVGFTSHLLALPRPFELLLSLLEGASDPVIPVLASAILTPLLATALQISAKPSPAIQDALPKFYRYLARVIRESQERDQQDLAVQRYVSLLRTPYARETFWDMKEETMEPLARLIEETAGGSTSGGGGGSGVTGTAGIVQGGNTAGIVQGGVPLQLVYHVLLAVWELTFDDTVAAELNLKYDLIPPITAILRNPVKEKITRVCLAILVNLITKAPAANLAPLLVTNILPHLQTLSQRFTAEADPDLLADLETVKARLETFLNEQTTLSSYRIEVMSGHLRWSPPHRNEGFWKRYARDILEDQEMVRQLARLLGSSQDKTVLAVACNDVGELVKEVPYSHKKWVELGVKNRVMELIGDSDPEVRYEALKAVQGFLQTAFSE